MRIVTTAVNIPGPVAAARLRDLGAAVTKVEPPSGDPLELAAPEWYERLVVGTEVVRLDLKAESLDGLLAGADVLLTSQRRSALERLGLAWAGLHERHPGLAQVAILGDGERAGHDLTYLASRGLLDPPHLPRTVMADLIGAERAVSAALAAVLGGGLPTYGLYEASDGWIAVAALEPGFRIRLAEGLGLAGLSRPALEGAFRSRTAAEWEAWARELDLPVEALHGP